MCRVGHWTKSHSDPAWVPCAQKLCKWTNSNPVGRTYKEFVHSHYQLIFSVILGGPHPQQADNCSCQFWSLDTVPALSLTRTRYYVRVPFPETVTTQVPLPAEAHRHHHPSGLVTAFTDASPQHSTRDSFFLKERREQSTPMFILSTPKSFAVQLSRATKCILSSTCTSNYLSNLLQPFLFGPFPEHSWFWDSTINKSHECLHKGHSGTMQNVLNKGFQKMPTCSAYMW